MSVEIYICDLKPEVQEQVLSDWLSRGTAPAQFGFGPHDALFDRDRLRGPFLSRRTRLRRAPRRIGARVLFLGRIEVRRDDRPSCQMGYHPTAGVRI